MPIGSMRAVNKLVGEEINFIPGGGDVSAMLRHTLVRVQMTRVHFPVRIHRLTNATR